MSRYWNDTTDEGRWGLLWRDCIIGGILVLIIGLAGCPPYNVWTRTLAGKAALRQAEWDRKILIQEAQAKEVAAKSWARAEVERAKGAQEANEILKTSLGGVEGYLRWLFIEKLDNIKRGQIIYLPTEAGIPLLEAGKRKDLL